MSLGDIKNPVIIKPSKETKIWTIICGIFVLSLFGGAAVHQIISVKGKIVFDWVYIIISCGVSLGAIAFVFWASIGRCEFYSDRIVDVALWKTSTTFYNEIKGYMIYSYRGASTIIFIPKDKFKKGPDIDLKTLKEGGDLWNRIQRNFINLDEVDDDIRIQNIIQDERSGKTIAVRIKQLKRIKLVCKISDILSLIMAFVGVFPQTMVFIAVPFLILIPIVSYIAIVRSGDMILLGLFKDKAYPNLGLSIFIASIALAMISLIHWNLLFLKEFWFPFIVVSLLAFILSLYCSKERRTETANIIITLVLSLSYGYGAVMSINGLYLKHINTYHTVILEKDADKGVLKFNRIKLAPWEFRKTDYIDNVETQLFKTHEPGDGLTINVKTGLLNIPVYNYE